MKAPGQPESGASAGRGQLSPAPPSLTWEQWLRIAGLVDEWWPASEFDGGHIRAYLPELDRHSADEVEAAVRACLHDGSAFAASLAQLMVKLERPVIERPAWVMLYNRLRWAVGRKVGENAAIHAPVREHAAIAQFVIEYGYDRLRAEPVTDAQLAGVVEKRMKDAWEDFPCAGSATRASAWGARARSRAPRRRPAAPGRLEGRAPCAVGRHRMRAGERLVRRKLKVHVVAGVDHFVAGQHGAFELEDIIYLGFVNQFGDAVLMPFERKDGEIVPVGVCQHAGQDMVWPLQALPKSFTVTDAMRDALANAQSAPPVFDPQTTKEDE